jgi:DNA-binding HxlR family transcriptional regulator
MSVNNPLYDGIVLHILDELSHQELQYVDLKQKLEVSDSSLTKRLSDLRQIGFIRVEARTSEKGRNYIVYMLTEQGKGAVKDIDIHNFIKKTAPYAIA